jgi:hypothetical protein
MFYCVHKVIHTTGLQPLRKKVLHRVWWSVSSFSSSILSFPSALLMCQKITWKKVSNMVAFQCTHYITVEAWNVFDSCCKLLEVHRHYRRICQPLRQHSLHLLNIQLCEYIEQLWTPLYMVATCIKAHEIGPCLALLTSESFLWYIIALYVSNILTSKWINHTGLPLNLQQCFSTYGLWPKCGSQRYSEWVTKRFHKSTYN